MYLNEIVKGTRRFWGMYLIAVAQRLALTRLKTEDAHLTTNYSLCCWTYKLNKETL